MKQARFCIQAVLVTVWWVAGCDDPAVCGNRVVEAGEECDINVYSIGNPFCKAQGFNGDGHVVCTPGCKIDWSPCTVSGRCGDGVVTPGYEECDGTDLGGVTCEDIGHAGALACNADCTYDLTACPHCGDGVVSLEYGELLESGYQGCESWGHFGGYLYTADCVTPDTIACGDYRVISFDPGVSAPRVASDGAGRVWLSGEVRGAFDGWTPSPGCPRLEEFWITWSDSDGGSEQELEGYRYDPACDQSFLAAIDDGGPTRVLRQEASVGSRIVKLQSLGARGMGLVRASEVPAGKRLDLEVVDRDGLQVESFGLTELEEPRWGIDLADGGLFSFFQFNMYGLLTVTSIDLATGEVLRRPPIDDFSTDSPDCDLVGYHRILGRFPRSDVGVFLLTFRRCEGSYDWGYDLVRLRYDGPTVTVELRRPQDWIPTNASVLYLHVDPLTLETEIAAVLGTQLFVRRLSAEGEPQDGWEAEIPSLYWPSAAFRMNDGGMVVAGVTVRPVDTPPSSPACVHNSSASLFARFHAPDGRLLESRIFTSDGLSHGNHFDELCGDSGPWFIQNGPDLLATGVFLHDAPFCSSHEPVPTHAGLPLHTCDIYVIRLPGSP